MEAVGVLDDAGHHARCGREGRLLELWAQAPAKDDEQAAAPVAGLLVAGHLLGEGSEVGAVAQAGGPRLCLLACREQDVAGADPLLGGELRAVRLVVPARLVAADLRGGPGLLTPGQLVDQHGPPHLVEPLAHEGVLLEAGPPRFLVEDLPLDQHRQELPRVLAHRRLAVRRQRVEGALEVKSGDDGVVDAGEDARAEIGRRPERLPLAVRIRRARHGSDQHQREGGARHGDPARAGVECRGEGGRHGSGHRSASSR